MFAARRIEKAAGNVCFSDLSGRYNVKLLLRDRVGKDRPWSRGSIAEQCNDGGVGGGAIGIHHFDPVKDRPAAGVIVCITQHSRRAGGWRGEAFKVVVTEPVGRFLKVKGWQAGHRRESPRNMGPKNPN